jgi:dihydroorotate dehydrogenase (fumarate)
MDLSTTYLGLNLEHPIVASAGPLTAQVDSMRALEKAGAAAVVLHSLFEEQITHDAAELDHHLGHGTESFAESLSYFPQPDEFRRGPEDYLELVDQAKQAVGIPVIGSLNGHSSGGWAEYAAKIESAGADALELNIYQIAADPTVSGTEIEDQCVGIVKLVKATVNIPVAVKISPFFSSIAAMAHRLDQAGADGLVLFNRFYQPDIDLDALEVVPDLVLSSRFEMRLPLRWVAILHGKIKADLAGTRGISTGTDVLKMMMAGADAVQCCSVLLREGPERIAGMLDEMKAWMTEHEYESVKQMKGSLSQKTCPDPAAFERANYMKVLNSYA